MLHSAVITAVSPNSPLKHSAHRCFVADLGNELLRLTSETAVTLHLRYKI